MLGFITLCSLRVPFAAAAAMFTRGRQAGLCECVRERLCVFAQENVCPCKRGVLPPSLSFSSSLVPTAAADR